MFNIYIPEVIYERLPKIYLILAAALIFAPFAPVKWLAIAGLISATAMIRRWRRVYREAERANEMMAMMEKYRRQDDQTAR